ncbi:orotidine-5'-phosphate decarboxylase [Dehalococcoidales bacterium]|nr:orotidine-5'-phosphate decarboxylase [Dehalococcoidales bacterium]
MNFIEKLVSATQKNKSLLCIGLDPDPELIPGKVGVFQFNKAIIDATSDLVCAYKLNLAFYEVLEAEGLDALKRTIKYIPDDIPVIGDAKHGDIGNTAKAYAKTIFTNFGFDAVTLNPYLGFDSVEPFIQYRDKGVFILCRTSNTGAKDLQNLISINIVAQPPEAQYKVSHLRIEPKEVKIGEQVGIEFQLKNVSNVKGSYTITLSGPLYEGVAQKAKEWNIYGNIGLVVGATYPEELRLIRQSHPDMPLLIPGIGAQGGELASAVRYGVNAQGEKAIISSSRQIIYASKGKDFAQAARQVALSLREQINNYRSTRTSSILR